MWFLEKRSAMSAAKKIFKSDLKKGVPKKVYKNLGMFKMMNKPLDIGSKIKLTYLVRDERSLGFTVEYRQDKTMGMYVIAYGLDLTFSQNAMHMIKEQYPSFRFNFEPSETRINFADKSFWNVKDFKKKFKENIRDWNNSGLYRLLMELYTV